MKRKKDSVRGRGVGLLVGGSERRGRTRKSGVRIYLREEKEDL